ncbi:NACHT domain-containing protein [Saccharothrix variisporea]|uniref:NACHT domain-containing protein n=1 Tax=Saccharothrix variisporea TaxID=543527 RepID=UPI0011C35004|nr:hypothetical protein [Saccharothrix variisporea]
MASAEEIEKWAIEALEGEVIKVQRLAARGAKKYILITNTQCSSHLDNGTRDRVQTWLDSELPIPAQVWWRDDIDRRLDGEREIKRTYGLLRDFLGIAELLNLKHPDIDEAEFIKIAKGDHRTNALVKYLAHQYRRDRVVKFKQAELEPQLLDVFIDIPLALSRSGERYDATYSRLLENMDGSLVRSSSKAAAINKWEGLLEDHTLAAFKTSNRFAGVPTASLLLSEIFRTELSPESEKFVLEGAPGQGKSTIGQYLCQVHRARLLNHSDVGKFPSEHRSSAIRLPLHVDFRDLAAWLRRQDPFDVTNTGTPGDWSPSLESFLAAQIRRASGGMDFTVSDLDLVLRATPALLVLDGLDEVPDLNDRRAVVACVNEALARIEPFSPSLRTIATSRPSSFAKTPGFSKREYYYLTLGDLPLPSVLEYTDGWLRSRNVAHQAAHEIRQVLGQRLGQPHIVDLARNPMQLAILLWLVRKKGLSLPDKRTALYRDYMETFLDREAEKSAIVRDERELILDLHGYVAWELHCRAEVGESNGNISETKLKALLKSYLQSRGYKKKKIDLVDQLFTGMTDRVMVLTSRVEKTFEFEVQPLREYFAAKYLYATARPSSQGAERSGNRSDRFEALLKNPYWWNVTRFYAGFSDVGELANLAELLEDLVVQEDSDFALIAYSRAAALSLLRDQVFSQKPRSLTRVVSLVSSDRAVALLYAAQEDLSIPPDSGGEEVAEAMIKRVEKLASTGIYDPGAAQFLSVNSVPGLESWWFDRWLAASDTLARRRWLKVALSMNLLPEFSDSQRLDILRQFDRDLLSWNAYTRAVPAGKAVVNEDDFSLFTDVFRDGLGLDLVPSRTGRTAVDAMAIASLQSVDLTIANKKSRVFLHGRQLSESHLDEASTTLAFEVSELFRSTWRRSVRNDLGAWVAFNDALEQILGGQCRRTLALAVAAGEVKSGNLNRSGVDNLSDQAVSPVFRARYARQRRHDVGWWMEQLERIDAGNEAFFALCCAVRWAPTAVIIKSRARLDRWARAIDPYLLRVLRMTYRQSGASADDGIESGMLARFGPETSYLFSRRLKLVEEVPILTRVARQKRNKTLAGLASAAWMGAMSHESKAAWTSERLSNLAEAYSIVRRSAVPYPAVIRPTSPLTVMQAREALRRAADLPNGMVTTANETLTADLGRRIAPLATVALRDQWFDQDLLD